MINTIAQLIIEKLRVFDFGMNLISDLVIGILLIYLVFFKSYFKEKGKSLATMDDLHTITTTVESIRSDFAKETEKLKHLLELDNQLTFDLRIQERKAILDHYEAYTHWLAVLYSFMFHGTDEKAISEMYTYVSDNIEKSFFVFDKSQSNLRLFVTDDELNKTSLEARLAGFELYQYINMKKFDFHEFCLKNRAIAFKEARIDMNEFEKFRQSHHQFLSNFNRERLAIYERIEPLRAKLTALSREAFIKTTH